MDYSTVDYFTEPSLIDDPEPYYDFLFEQGPVWREPNHGMFIVSGYDEILAVERDPSTFSSCNAFSGPFPPLPEAPAGDDADAVIEKWRHLFANSESLVTFDPPAHTAHRGLMMRLLTPRRLQENEEFMRCAAGEELDRVTADGRCEFLGDFAQPFSMLVIADLLGIPHEDRPALREQILAKGSPGIVGQRRLHALLDIPPADAPHLARVRADCRGDIGERPLRVQQFQYSDPLPRTRGHRAPAVRLIGQEPAVLGTQVEAGKARTSG